VALENTYRRAIDLLRLDDLDGASRIAEAELARFSDKGNSTEVWAARFVRAEVLRLKGRTQQALHYLEGHELLNCPDITDIEPYANLKKHRGYYSGLLGRYKPAHDLLQDAEVMARDEAQGELLAEVHQRQAMVLFLQEDYISSDRMFRLVLEQGEKIKNWYFRANGRWGIGKNLMIQKLYQEAIPWLESSLAILEDTGARLFMATVWSELAVCHLGLGSDCLALELLHKAASVNLESGAIHNYQVVLANIGNVYLQRGECLRAIGYYREALALARDIKDQVSVQKWTSNIGLAYLRIRSVIDKCYPRSA
jgi:tetratricopeptide (TPR) repeat protein